MYVYDKPGDDCKVLAVGFRAQCVVLSVVIWSDLTLQPEERGRGGGG